jgi:hypothetical protein
VEAAFAGDARVDDILSAVGRSSLTNGTAVASLPKRVQVLFEIVAHRVDKGRPALSKSKKYTN